MLKSNIRNTIRINVQLIKDQLEREKSKSATVLAKDLRDLINNELNDYLRSMAMAKPAKYKDFTDLLHTIIENNNQLIVNHLAAIKRKKEQLKASI